MTKESADDAGGWLLIALDEKMARRQGLPAQVPVPKAEFEGLADKGLNIEKARKWVKEFLTTSPAGQDGTWRRRNSALVTGLEGFIDNAPLWDKAQKAFAENDYEGAIKALKRITIMNGDDHAAKLNLASALANQGDFEGALKNFKAIRKTFEGDADYHVAVGHVYLRQQDKDQALNEMVARARGQARLPACARGAHPDGRSARHLREPARRVLAHLRPYGLGRAVPRRPVGLGAARSRPSSWSSSRTTSGRTGTRWPSSPPSARSRWAMRPTPADIERASLARVASLRALGRTGEALAAAEAYAAQVPSSAGAQVELSRALLAAGRADESRAAIDRALELDPGDLSALMTRFWPADPNDIKAHPRRHPGAPRLRRGARGLGGCVAHGRARLPGDGPHRRCARALRARARHHACR